jgi:centrosomal protein CEP104
MEEQNEITRDPYSKTSEMYHFIGFHSVTTSSQNTGSSLDNLTYALKPTEHGWESARFTSFPQEVIFKLEARTKLEYILIASKKSLGAKHVKILVGDGLSGSFMDVHYQTAGEVKALTHVPVKVKCYGIGSFMKLMFEDEPERTQANPYGQVSLSLFRVWGMPVSYYKGIKFEEGNKEAKERIDKILIELGVPIDGTEWSHSDPHSYKYTPVDDDTRETLAALEQIWDQALKAEDYARAGSVSKDIKRLIEIGAKILVLRRELAEAVAKEDFGRAIGIKEQLVKLERTRDNMDAFYETSRYEEMIVMQRPSTAARKLREQLEQEEKERAKAEKLKRIEEQRLKELEEKRLLELEQRRHSQLIGEEMERKRLEEEERVRAEEEAELKRIREEEAKREEEKKEEVAKSLRESKSRGSIEENVVTEEVKKPTPRRSKPTKEVKKSRVREQTIKGCHDNVGLTTGDAELEVYLVPLLNAAGGPVKDLNEDSHIPKDMLEVCGVKMWNALRSESWRHREAAGTAFLQYLEAPLVPS